MATQKNIERARRGAALLDRMFGRGWRRKIRRRSLRMELGFMRPGECGCILAQLDLARTGESGSFTRFADRFGLGSLASRGFVVDGHREVESEYADLTEAWREVLREDS
jgi:hypothetical protein